MTNPALSRWLLPWLMLLTVCLGALHWAKTAPPANSFLAAESSTAQARNALPLLGNPDFGLKDVSGASVGAKGGTTAGEVINVNPAELRWTQTTAGGGGRADVLRESIGSKGYVGDPIDVVRTVDGLVTVDHTRAAVALEQGITSIPATVHLPTDLLPASMAGRFGNATTWGEAAAYRAANQRPPLPPTGTPNPPKLPTPKN